MAKLTDKFFNRVIEGPLEMESGEQAQVQTEINKVLPQPQVSDEGKALVVNNQGKYALGSELPSPSGQGGKVLGVNAGGTGYELKDPSGVNSVDIENIYDSDEHKRFVEGDVDLGPGGSAITKTYGKWSLSGTHLLIVLAGTIPASSVLADGTTIATVYSLPSWIVAKIFPTSGTVVTAKKVTFFKADTPWVYEDKLLALVKYNNNITIGNPFGNQTITNDSSFRLQIDLLIDNE